LEDFVILAETTGDIFSGCSISSFEVRNMVDINSEYILIGIQALSDPIFTTDPWAICAATVYQTTCQTK
jgi:hypothetical protein